MPTAYMLEAQGPDGLPHPGHGRTVVVEGLAVGPGAGLQGEDEGADPERLELLQRAPGALRGPPVDEPDAVEAARRLFLEVGQIFVVDPEAQLAYLGVGVVEQRHQRVGEGQLAGDAVCLELRPAGLEGAGARARQGVVLGEDTGELLGEELAVPGGQVPGVVAVDDPGDAVLERRGGPVVEDVLGERDVVVGREDLGSRRQARRRGGGMSVTVLGRAQPLGGVDLERSTSTRHTASPSATSVRGDDAGPYYFDVVMLSRARRCATGGERKGRVHE
jgi:hypothetical protein